MIMTEKAGDSGFFAVERPTLLKVFELGMNASVAYLVLASGTQHDNQHTFWSVNAIETHTGISRSRAKIAVTTLCDSKMVQKIKDGERPRYRLLPYYEVSLIGIRKKMQRRHHQNLIISGFQMVWSLGLERRLPHWKKYGRLVKS